MRTPHALRAGLEDPTRWGSALRVPARVRRLDAATVVWINRRWFVERGIDVVGASGRAAVERWLLDRFAWQTVVDGGPVRTALGADRYGATGWVPHGGSGRAVLRDRYQIKGVGMTPLVGREADWFHSHGSLWMEEAIREAVYSELFALERGEGVVPTLAVIDAGMNLRHADGRYGERRALSVRPFAPRIAHLQRAYGFAPLSWGWPTAGNRVQRLDVLRTRQAWRRYGRAVGDGALPHPLALFARVGGHAAFCHLWRLSHGGFFASNLTLAGELIDFGAATSLAQWRPVALSEHGAWFGGEEANLAQVAQSFAFHAEKYGGALRGLHAEALMDAYRDGYARERGKTLLRVAGDPGGAVDLDARIAVGRPACGGTRGHATPEALARFAPRPGLDRAGVQALLFGQVVRERGVLPPQAADVDAVMTQLLSQGARAFPAWPDLGRIVAQACDGCCVLVIDEDADGRQRLQLEAPLLEGRVLLFGAWHARETLGEPLGEASGANAPDAQPSRWRMRLPLAQRVSPQARTTIRLGGIAWTLPPLAWRDA